MAHSPSRESEFRCDMFTSAGSRLARSLNAGGMLPFFYLHTRVRKLVTSQEVILAMFSPPGEVSPEAFYR